MKKCVFSCLQKYHEKMRLFKEKAHGRDNSMGLFFNILITNTIYKRWYGCFCVIQRLLLGHLLQNAGAVAFDDADHIAP